MFSWTCERIGKLDHKLSDVVFFSFRFFEDDTFIESLVPISVSILYRFFTQNQSSATETPQGVHGTPPRIAELHQRVSRIKVMYYTTQDCHVTIVLMHHLVVTA